ncbi:cysteine hydrolase [Stappia sp. MMSF_3263]|uniref:cysteine hydrolase n=1 Tax=Stappia sp. MMSF_3263 TaxID=3046693 RepID=UPI00273FAFC0|nr:cysteine hydrolase [Stappia sp. MMSF_3263]
MWFALAGLLVAVLIGLFLIFSATARRLARPTTGSLIDIAARPGRALLVIDMQEDFTRALGKRAFDTGARDDALSRVNDLIHAAHEEGSPVIFLRQQFRDWPVRLVASLLLGGAGNPGRAGQRIDRALDTQGAHVLVKHVGDGFSNRELEWLLDEAGVGRLRLAGLDLAHCVAQTAHGARNRGYAVEIDEAGSLTADPRRWLREKAVLAAREVRFAPCMERRMPHLGRNMSLESSGYR